MKSTDLRHDSNASLQPLFLLGIIVLMVVMQAILVPGSVTGSQLWLVSRQASALGIIALGQGDTQTLSTSLLTAFDTTIAGLCAAAVCLVVTTLRKRWYGGYMADLETLVDCVCEEEAA